MHRAAATLKTEKGCVMGAPWKRQVHRHIRAPRNPRIRSSFLSRAEMSGASCQFRFGARVTREVYSSTVFTSLLVKLHRASHTARIGLRARRSADEDETVVIIFENDRSRV